jgi:4-amino-4-deoxy-L-arabinose transferase-like glycosyltransferase
MSETLPPPTTKALLAIVALAVVLRLLFIWVIDPHPVFSGGDVHWYLSYGLQLVKGTEPPLPTGPVYLLYDGVLQVLFPAPAYDASAVIAIIRFLNVGWHVLMIVGVYVLGMRYFSRTVGLGAALVLAVSPAFIIEAGTPLTESVFMGLLFGTLALYAWYQDRPNARLIAAVGILLGIATLTRAVLLLFPVVLVVHLVRLHGWRQGGRWAALLVACYSLVASTWTIYNWIKWQHMVIGAEGLAGFLWMGAYGQQSPTQADQALGSGVLEGNRNELFLEQLWDRIRSDLPEYVKARLSNIAGGYLQPHNTTYFPSESLKDAVAAWLKNDRSLSGLLALTQKDAFWAKLVLYLFHGWALVFGAVGLILYVRRFWTLLPVYGYIAYTTAVHTVLLALPRYLFPVEPLLILFASAAAVALLRAVQERRAKSWVLLRENQ